MSSRNKDTKAGSDRKVSDTHCELLIVLPCFGGTRVHYRKTESWLRG